MRRCGILSILLAGCALALAQQQPDPRQQVRQRFEATGLKPGAAFPEVDIYDAVGKPFNTRSLKGKYTVVVNGCLT